IGSRAKSRWCSALPRPRRSRRSKPRLPRVPAAVPSPRRARARTKTWWWRKRRHKRPHNPPEQTRSTAATQDFSIESVRTQGGDNLLLEKEKDAEEMSRRSHNYARFAKKMKPRSG